MKDIWGPFLVIAPKTTIHNWLQELNRFSPCFNVCPYWGDEKTSRQVLRQDWGSKLMYSRNSPMHIVVTTFKIFQSDEKKFNKIKWQYMIVDEAQHIKSHHSKRWQVLLKLNCRNRLLLTGTPVQNNMTEVKCDINLLIVLLVLLLLILQILSLLLILIIEANIFFNFNNINGDIVIINQSGLYYF